MTSCSRTQDYYSRTQMLNLMSLKISRFTTFLRVCLCVCLCFKYQSTTWKMIMGKTGQREAKDKEKVMNTMIMVATNLLGESANLGFKLGPLWPKKIWNMWKFREENVKTFCRELGSGLKRWKFLQRLLPTHLIEDTWKQTKAACQVASARERFFLNMFVIYLGNYNPRL